MTSGSTASTSSTPSEVSWSDVAAGARYILDQLGPARHSDNLLVHWVAQRLAEYVAEAETASNDAIRDAARDKAALLVAQLWHARGGWPRGWPPDSAREFVDGIKNAQSRYYGDPGPLPPWLSTLPALVGLEAEEKEAWVYAALLELDADELRRALDAFPEEEADSDEAQRMRWQLERHEHACEWIADQAQEGEDPAKRPQRAKILERVLADLAERRAALYDRALRDVRSGRSRKADRPASPTLRRLARRAR
jgi:hypothetical protein